MNITTGSYIVECIDCGGLLPVGHALCEECFAFCPECEESIVSGLCADSECPLHKA